MARQLTRTVWTLCALGAVAIHAGCAALALASVHREDAQDLGAPAIEIGVELASPRLEPTDLPVNLPSSTAIPDKKPDKPTYVTIKADLSVAINETPVKRVDLARSLDAMSANAKDERIFLRADRGVPYGELMDVLERLRIGGYSKIALVALEGVPNDATGAAASQP